MVSTLVVVVIFLLSSRASSSSSSLLPWRARAQSGRKLVIYLSAARVALVRLLKSSHSLDWKYEIAKRKVNPSGESARGSQCACAAFPSAAPTQTLALYAPAPCRSPIDELEGRNPLGNIAKDEEEERAPAAEQTPLPRSLPSTATCPAARARSLATGTIV